MRRMELELQCPRCGARELAPREGVYECAGCGAAFPVVGGVPRFVPAELYSASFGYQWNRFARTQLDSASGTTRSRDTFLEKTGWSLAALGGKRVLDAGCGMGRFAEVCAAAGAEVHAVDLSTAVEAARRNLAGRAGVHIYQADIMRLPFPEASFDFIYSIGVLHHTPDTRAAFLRLPPLLKPGGAIAIWVYSTELRAFPGAELWRRVTPRLPTRWLLGLCWLAVPLYYPLRIPRLGNVMSRWLFTNMDPDPAWRWLSTFDWYAPPYQWKHTYDEVAEWFREAGLVDVKRAAFPVAMSGIRPPEVPRSGHP